MSEASRKVYNSKKWKELRAQVLAEEAHRCHWCGGKANQVDHVVELDQAPELAYERSNLVAACQKCNSRRGSTYQAKRNAQRHQRTVFGLAGQDPAPTLARI